MTHRRPPVAWYRTRVLGVANGLGALDGAGVGGHDVGVSTDHGILKVGGGASRSGEVCLVRSAPRTRL
jgi:hypothetical protein